MILLKLIIYALSWFIPLNKKRFLFSSWGGRRYGDNSKYFFEYLTKNHTEYECVWYTTELSVAETVALQGGKVIFGRSIKSIWYHLTAKAVFCNCHQSTDFFGLFLNVKTTTFNLWHGTPMKYIGADAIASGIGDVGSQQGAWHWHIMTALKNTLRCIGLEGRVYLLASSDSVAQLFYRAFNLPAGRVIIAPYPKLRLSNLAIPNGMEVSGLRIKILFAPTYRGEYNSEIDLLTAHGFSLERVERWLADINGQLTIRLHPANSLPAVMQQKIAASKYIICDASEDLYTEFATYNVVISDFSSVYYDALALNKTVIFMPFDHDNYVQQERQLYVRAEEISIGLLVQTWPEIIAKFNDYLYPSELMQQRQAALRSRYYPHSLAMDPSAVLFERVKCTLKI
ncbi:MAG: CDP-glycerol glycerophosphotransferase family protein [Aeromonas sp.]